MVQLYGKEWTRAELARHIGLESQLGGVRLGELADGNRRGLRTAEIDTGSGLAYTVLLDRGMDIGVARYKGASLVWESPTGRYTRPTLRRRGVAGCAPSTAAWW